jgi:hypothetical protein
VLAAPPFRCDNDSNRSVGRWNQNWFQGVSKASQTGQESAPARFCLFVKLPPENTADNNHNFFAFCKPESFS